MQWNNKITSMLECRYPILLAGMGGVSRHQLAAAVSNAGGFGCLGMVREIPSLIENEIKQLRTLSENPFGVNLIPAATEKTLLKKQLTTCIDLNVPVVVLFWDVDEVAIKLLKSHHIKVIHQVGSVRDAQQALDCDVDALIVQGIEAGGHVRATESISTLLGKILKKSTVPVIASGGIATGLHLYKLLRAGASGVSCGTAFLAAKESNAHPYHKEKIIQASAKDTMVTTIFQKNWNIPAPVRVLRSCIEENQKIDKPDNEVIGTQDQQPIYRYSTDSPLVGTQGQLELMALYAGNSCEYVSEIKPAKNILGSMIADAERYFRAENKTDISSSPCFFGNYSKDINPDYF